VTRLDELVVCSLEAWDDVWRRNQFLVDELLRRHDALRVLFVEPPTDPIFDLTKGRRPRRPRMRSLREDGRLHTLRPLKAFPRRIGPLTDRLLRRQTIAAARRLGFERPTLWLNDLTYAPLIDETGWPTVYDATDDWLLAPLPAREVDRLRALEEIALARAHEVVVCSPELARSRGRARSVTLVPNAVDVEHFRRPQPRPHDLPAAPTAVYAGTLHEARLDVRLVVEVARALPEAAIVLVGPDSLDDAARRALASQPNVHVLGERPYATVAAYLQHADVVIVPHSVNPFTESLDPIKAYECLAVDTPTVATPVAGFRELAEVLDVVESSAFAARVADVLGGDSVRRDRVAPPRWEERAVEFEATLLAAGA